MKKSGFVITEPPICGYNQDTDVSKVQPYGSVFLPEALAKHSIPANLEGFEDNYNGIEKPESIIGTPKDVFEAAQMRQTITDYKPSEKSVE